MERNRKISVTELHEATGTGDVNKVQELLADPASKDIVNRRSGPYKQTALHRACKQGHYTTVKALLAAENISVDPLDSRDWTPLCYAVDGGFLKIITLLLKHGANVNHTLLNGDRPLHLAALRSHTAVCRELLNNGAVVDVSNHNGWTPLHIAAGEGEFPTVELLLAHNADVNKKTGLGDTACNLAARSDSEGIIKVLFKKGADLTLSNNNGEEPIHSAVMAGHWHSLKYLMKNGVDMKAKTNCGMTIFHLAAKTGHLDMLQKLKNNLSKADFKELINGKTDSLKGIWISTVGCGLILSQVTPLHFAALEGHPSIVKLFISSGADDTILDGNNHTALELVKHYKDQIQVWDIDKIHEVIEILTKYTAGNLAFDEDDGMAVASESGHSHRGHDSDYYSTSSVTTEDVESIMDELEEELHLYSKDKVSVKKINRQKRAARRKLDRNEVMDEREKKVLYKKLSAIEEQLQQLNSSKSRNPSPERPKDNSPKYTGDYLY